MERPAAFASRVIRRLLVDHAWRSHVPRIPLDLAHVAVGPVSAEVLEVVAPREAKMAELRFLCGLSLEEAADVLGISPRTADKDWKLARTWLQKRLSNVNPPDSSGLIELTFDLACVRV
jgi:RNA polymerase sigma-70 factor, ECF subfamily